MSDAVRLHRFIAQCGLASRRKAEELIATGRVSVNGETVTGQGVKVSEEDVVTVDGLRLERARRFYLVMNKPKGVLTTMSDPEDRRTVVPYLPRLPAPVKPVGRLDKDTEGLLIFTNDGDLAMRLTHPRFGVEKEYLAVVKGTPDERALDRLRKGVWLPEGGKTSPARVTLRGADPKTDRSTLEIVVHEGRKRQVRLMCEAVGHPVKALTRTRFGPLRVRGMAPGECRMIGQRDVQELRRLVGLEESG